MKLTCSLEAFRKTVSHTEKITSKQTTLPILNNILIRGKKNDLHFLATNLELGIISKISAKVEKDGEIAVPARIISAFVNNIGEETSEKIDIEIKNQNLHLNTDIYRVAIKGLNTDEFPIIPQKKGSFLFQLDPILIKDALVRLFPSVAIGEARQELMGIYMGFGENDIVFTSTDSYRLAEISIPIKKTGQEYKVFTKNISSVIIPLATLSELIKIIESPDDLVEVFIDENQIFFSVDGVQLVSRLINGSYPEYKQIIPEKFNTRAVVDKSLILKSLRMASVFTKNKSNEIQLEVKKDSSKVIISSQSEELGSNVSKIPAEINGLDQNITFNAKFLIDGVNVINGDKIAFLFNGATSPAAIKKLNNKGEVDHGFVYIIMPIKNQ